MLFVSRSKLFSFKCSLFGICCIIYIGIFSSSASEIIEEGSNSIDVLGNSIEVDTDFEVRSGKVMFWRNLVKGFARMLFENRNLNTWLLV